VEQNTLYCVGCDTERFTNNSWVVLVLWPYGGLLAENEEPVADVTPQSMAMRLRERKPGILEFYTASCPYCRKIEPVLTRINAEYSDQIFMVKMNAEKYPDEAGKYRIPGVPALVFFDSEGHPKALVAGYRDFQNLTEILKGLKFIE